MKWFLVVWILTNGNWVEGDPKDGWGPMEQPNKATCLEKRDRANEIQVGKYWFTCEER